MHRGIPGKFWYTATDWTFWKDYQFREPHKVITDLHRELGLSPTPCPFLPYKAT